jgi:hypothetical protein
MMLENKYLLDSRYGRAKEEFFKCYIEDEGKKEALLLALLCCVKMGDLREGRMILDTLVRSGVEKMEVEVPPAIDETFAPVLQSFIGGGKWSFRIANDEGIIRFWSKSVEDRS